MEDKFLIKGSSGFGHFVLKILCGILIGISAVLPGVSGGVLCVIFGIYPVVVELLSHPFLNLKSKVRILLPYMIGILLGFWGVARILELLLSRFEAPVTCVFIGLVAGMLPSLFVSVGDGKSSIFSYVGLCLSCITVLALLLSLGNMRIVTTPSFFWYILCGVALAISVIVPGMSFSTLLMPLGLYTPLVQGIGDFDLMVIIPAGLGAVSTILVFSRFISALFKNYYSVAQNIVIGVIIAATVVIIPFESFGLSLYSALINTLCIAVGVGCAMILSRLSEKYEDKKNISPIGENI